MEELEESLNETVEMTLEDLEAWVRQQRDQVRLKMHLAKADARDQWTRLESMWDQAQRGLKEMTHAVHESGQEVRAAASLTAEQLVREVQPRPMTREALQLLLEELRDGYTRVLHTMER